MLDDQLHARARERAARLSNPDKKQLRFNDIVRVAKSFYSADLFSGVNELVSACDRDCPSLYAGGEPMWQTLENEFGWMINQTEGK